MHRILGQITLNARHDRNAGFQQTYTLNIDTTLKFSMRTALRFVVASLIFVSSALASPATDLFDQAREYLLIQYFGPSTLNLETHAATYRAQLETACASEPDTCPFERAEPIIAQMLSALEDRHAYYMNAEAVRNAVANSSGTNLTPSPRLGFGHRGFVNADNAPRSLDRLVTNVLPGGPADRAGLRYGDRFVGIDGVSFASLGTLEAVNAALSAFSSRVASGASVKLNVVRGVERAALDLQMRGEIINVAQLPSFERRTDGVLVVTLRTFTVSGVAQRIHDELVRRIAANDTRAVVIDMRGNGGGFASERWWTVGAFIDNPEPMRRVPRYDAATNTYEEAYARGRYIQRNASGAEIGSQRLGAFTRWEGPVALLVDGGCASACEYLSSSFQRAKRGPVIGEATVGIGSTNTARFALANGGAVSIPTLRTFWPDGTPLPDRITPDIAINDMAFTLLETGRDEALERAVQHVTAPAQ
jgi:carboxyl-terminal processing protease